MVADSHNHIFRGKGIPTWALIGFVFILIFMSARFFWQGLHEFSMADKIYYFSSSALCLIVIVTRIFLRSSMPYDLKYQIIDGKVKIRHSDKLTREIPISVITKLSPSLKSGVNEKLKVESGVNLFQVNLVIFSQDLAGGFPMAVVNRNSFIALLLQQNPAIEVDEKLKSASPKKYL